MAALILSGSAIPAFGQGARVGEATRQINPSINATDPALLSGMRGGESDGGGCNVPTDAAHSPLFGSKSFTQQMLRFEEFGSRSLEHESEYSECLQDYDTKQAGYCAPLPSPTLGGPSKGGSYTAYGSPTNKELDTTLNNPLYPYPTEYSNKYYPNPWQDAIEQEHTGPMEPLVAGDPHPTTGDGRPPGPQFGHQRWEEFYPQVYTQTAQAGVRPNGGARDSEQMHSYTQGEFSPGGLYHNTVHGMAAKACRESTSAAASISENEAACLGVANPLIRDGLDRMCTWDAALTSMEPSRRSSR